MRGEHHHGEGGPYDDARADHLCDDDARSDRPRGEEGVYDDARADQHCGDEEGRGTYAYDYGPIPPLMRGEHHHEGEPYDDARVGHHSDKEGGRGEYAYEIPPLVRADHRYGRRRVYDDADEDRRCGAPDESA